MYSRLKAMSIITSLFIITSIVYYEDVIREALVLRPTFIILGNQTRKLVKSNNEEEIVKLIKDIRVLDHDIHKASLVMYDAFILIEILCVLNLMFFIS